MKRIIFLMAVVALSFAAQTAAPAVAGERDVAFQRHDSSYFEKNNSGLKGEKSYLVINSRRRFDEVFGPAATMGQNSFLPPDAFKSKIVVAAIKRGSMRRYGDVNVTAKGRTLTVSYTTQDDAPGSAAFSSPLILAVDKGRYRQVVFMENGRRAAAVSVARGR